MANQIIQYQCPHCKHITNYDFSTCPACGVEIATGGKTWKTHWKYSEPPCLHDGKSKTALEIIRFIESNKNTSNKPNMH